MMPIQSLASIIESPEHRVSFTMVSDDRAPGAARTFTREMLSVWGLEDLMDRTVLIVSELTTNAERHGGASSGTERPSDANGRVVAEHITLTLAAQSGIVGIEVEDNSPLPPIPRTSGPDSLDGRGLLLVIAEADAWTACPNEDGSGKRVLAVVKRREPLHRGLTPTAHPIQPHSLAMEAFAMPAQHAPVASSLPPRMKLEDVVTQHVLLLDLDGVLVDTRPVMQEAWRAVQRGHGIDLPFEMYEQHLGRPFNDIMERLELADADRIHQTYTEASQAASPLARPFEGVEEVLHAFAAADWRLGVVTSKPLDRAAPLLAQLGCPFATVRAPGGPGRGKPAPDPLLLALVDLAADPASGTYVGDMEVDREAARRAGVSYVHAAWGYGAPGTPAPQIAQSPADLLRLLNVSGKSAPLIEGSLL
ncbi:HAD-IA family hydrolase [Streptomyces phaeochromogenes]|uniref:HAD-IA family hydrolase n=1 Tax=Streptomyces phaeochromogenes TaxID=1923 RepID=UPI003409F6C4